MILKIISLLIIVILWAISILIFWFIYPAFKVKDICKFFFDVMDRIWNFEKD